MAHTTRYAFVEVGVMLLVACCVLLPATVDAQFDESGFIIQQQRFQPLEPLTSIPAISNVYSDANAGYFSLGTLVNNFFKIALSIGAILAVLRIAYAGYEYMTSEAWGSVGKARETLTNSVIGLLLLMSIWLILYQINPCILRLDILQSLTGSGSCNPQTERANQ